MLRSLGLALGASALMLGYHMIVVLNNTVPSSVLKKKHNEIAYHLLYVERTIANYDLF
jgi:hypothetical protein